MIVAETTGVAIKGITIKGFITIGVAKIIGSLILKIAGANDILPSSLN